MLTLRLGDFVASAVVQAIQTGSLEALQRQLGEHPGLAAARIERDKGGAITPLHAATHWPGHFPNGAAVVKMLIAAGADPNVPTIGSQHSETPLHWAASSDDVDVAAALVVGGADLEAQGASIGGGTPLDDAVGYGQWQVARLLVERGARVDRLWHAAALGLMSRLEKLLTAPVPPTPNEINDAFWQACHGGQLRAAKYLADSGADVNWVPDYAKDAALDIAGAPDGRRADLVRWLHDNGARSANPSK